MSYQSPTLDVLDSYDNLSSLNPSADLANAGRSAPQHAPPDPLATLSLPERSESHLSYVSSESKTNLITDNGERRNASVFRWTLPLHSNSFKNVSQKPWHGWRVVLLDSWLNILLVFLPVTWVLAVVMPGSVQLIFIFCILSMVPLVKLHDLATDELAIRIGGAKTGLLNASLSNIVELVIAITALRKCEIRVVQSSLIGSMLSKLLLVLGMCFFAGGLRFTEQGFDSTATQIHSSLLSISVGALLLPAAYHFALRDSTDADISTDDQKRDILRMSHSVSIVLLCIYVSYLLFQLWSHTHLYKDSTETSNKHSVRIPMERRFKGMAEKNRQKHTSGLDLDPEKWQSSVTSLSCVTELPSMSRTTSSSSPYSSTSQITLAGGNSGPGSSLATPAPAANPTVRLVRMRNRHDSQESNESGSLASSHSSQTSFQGDDLDLRTESEEFKRMEDLPSIKADPLEREPRLSWPMTMILLTVVTVLVAINAEWLVESMDGISTTISKEWIGLILLPTVSSIAECVTAVRSTVKDQLTLSVSVAVGSTIQTALFVIPFTVLLGWIFDKPLALLFDPFESVVLYISVHTMGYVVADGKSNWLEGVILICLYFIIAVSFWFYPGSSLGSSLAVCSS